VKISLEFVLGRGLSSKSHAGDGGPIVMHYAKFYHFTVIENGEKASLPSKFLKALIQL